MSPQGHPPLTVILITHNNQDTVVRCLDSVRWAGEIIVVDRGSTDKTLELVRHYNANVVSHPSRHLAIVQQFALSLAKYEWILWLEPYDWVEEMLKHEIDGLLANPDRQRDGYFIATKLHFQGEWLRYGRQFPNYQLRLFQKQNAEISTHIYHQGIQLAGELGYLENALGTEPYSSVDTLFEMMNHQSTRAAYAAFEQGGPQPFQTSHLNLVIRPALTFLNRLFIQKGWLDGTKGITLAMAEAYFNFLKYAKLRHHLFESKA